MSRTERRKRPNQNTGSRMTMHRRSILLLLILAALFTLVSCASGQPAAEADASPSSSSEASSSADDGHTVKLTVWGAEEDAGLLEELISTFKQNHAAEATFEITVEPQSESSCKDSLLADLENGPDVFAFADDQVATLAAAGAIEPLEDESAVRSANLDAAVEAASVGDTLYAYPLTADNGYFLYYDKRYFTEEDVKTMDSLLAAAERAGKKFAMDWTSGWYVYAFFGNTGLELGLNDDGITNFCTWNSADSPITGVDVAEAMLAIAQSPAFESLNDEEFMAGVRDGSVGAGVSGVWNAVGIEEVWGENMGAAKLPTFTCNGQQIQMASFSGCKLIGVNAYSQEPDWATALAEWIASEEAQRLRFAERGQGPANSNAAISEEVQESVAIAALLDQSEYSQLQRVGGKFWDPVSAFATSMAEGNPSGADLQAQLDAMVEGITAR